MTHHQIRIGRHLIPLTLDEYSQVKRLRISDLEDGTFRVIVDGKQYRISKYDDRQYMVDYYKKTIYRWVPIGLVSL